MKKDARLFTSLNPSPRLVSVVKGLLPLLLLLLLIAPAWAGGRPLLPPQVSAAVAGLQPIGRLAATNRLNLAIGLPLRNPAGAGAVAEGAL